MYIEYPTDSLCSEYTIGYSQCESTVSVTCRIIVLTHSPAKTVLLE